MDDESPDNCPRICEDWKNRDNRIKLVVVQEELQQKKQIAGNTEVLLTADNLQQYVKKIEVDHKKNTYTEFVF